ncbi:MAG: YihY/virulence factor BrkB family protein [Bacteriovorax sp.]|nr:YihY/virulence factor BrkB family protein [Bacteriovorax sp.]
MKLITPALKKNFNKFADGIDRHEIFTLAGSLAYTTALALAPFVLILLSLSSLLSPELQDKLWVQLATTVGEKAGDTVLAIIDNTKKSSTMSGISGTIGFIILVVSASAIFAQLRVALDKINEHKVEKSRSGIMLFLKDRFLSMGLVFGFAFLSIVSLMVSTMMSVFLEGGEGFLWSLLSMVINLSLFAILFTAIYRVIPSDEMEWKKCRVAGFVSAIFYIIGKNFITLYLAHAGLESAYGAAGSLVAFLAWVYYTSLTILVSFEFTKDIVFHEEEKKTTTVFPETV